jgi:hypothetical protein
MEFEKNFKIYFGNGVYFGICHNHGRVERINKHKNLRKENLFILLHISKRYAII